MRLETLQAERRREAWRSVPEVNPPPWAKWTIRLVKGVWLTWIFPPTPRSCGFTCRPPGAEWQKSICKSNPASHFPANSPRDWNRDFVSEDSCMIQKAVRLRKQSWNCFGAHPTARADCYSADWLKPAVTREEDGAFEKCHHPWLGFSCESLIRISNRTNSSFSVKAPATPPPAKRCWLHAGNSSLNR